MAHTWGRGAASGAGCPERGLSSLAEGRSPCRRPSPGGDGLHPTAAAPTPAPWAVTSNHNKTATVRQKTLICSIYHQPGARLSTKKPLSHQILKTAHFAFKETEATERLIDFSKTAHLPSGELSQSGPFTTPHPYPDTGPGWRQPPSQGQGGTEEGTLCHRPNSTFIMPPKSDAQTSGSSLYPSAWHPDNAWHQKVAQ